MSTSGRGLTPCERRFVEEYVADENGVQAYFRAFGRTKANGTPRSYRAARIQSHRLLTNANIQAEIAAAQAEYVRRTRVSKARVLREVAALATSDQGDLFEEDPATGLPKPRPWSQVPPAARRAIMSVKIKKRIVRRAKDPDDLQEEVEEVEYKLHAKSAELDKLCKKLGFYSDAPAAAGGGVIEVEANGRDDPPAG